MCSGITKREERIWTENRKFCRFFLLQVNDALFPIGGYSHSQGLETYIQQGSVCDEKTAAEYIHKKLRFALAYTDLLAVRLAWELTDQSDTDGLDELEEILGASRIPFEQREASRKMVPVLQKQSKNCMQKRCR